MIEKQTQGLEKEKKVVSFCVPPHLHERVTKIGGLRDSLRSIANRECVLVDQIAAQFVDYGIRLYDRGEIHFETRPSRVTHKMDVAWVDIEDSEPINLNFEKEKNETKLTSLVRLSYRWMEKSSLLHKRITEISTQHAIRNGEVLVILLELGVSKYVAGELGFRKEQPIIRNTVTGWKALKK